MFHWFHIRFPKNYESQWSVSGALFLSLVSQLLTLLYGELINQDIQQRMYLHLNLN